MLVLRTRQHVVVAARDGGKPQPSELLQRNGIMSFVWLRLRMVDGLMEDALSIWRAWEFSTGLEEHYLL